MNRGADDEEDGQERFSRTRDVVLRRLEATNGPGGLGFAKAANTRVRRRLHAARTRLDADDAWSKDAATVTALDSVFWVAKLLGSSPKIKDEGLVSVRTAINTLNASVSESSASSVGSSGPSDASSHSSPPVEGTPRRAQRGPRHEQSQQLERHHGAALSTTIAQSSHAPAARSAAAAGQQAGAATSTAAPARERVDYMRGLPSAAASLRHPGPPAASASAGTIFERPPALERRRGQGTEDIASARKRRKVPKKAEPMETREVTAVPQRAAMAVRAAAEVILPRQDLMAPASPFSLSPDAYKAFLWLESGRRKLQRIEARRISRQRQQKRKRSDYHELAAPGVHQEAGSELGKSKRIHAGASTQGAPAPLRARARPSTVETPNFCAVTEDLGQRLLGVALASTERGNVHRLRKTLRRARSLFGATAAAWIALQSLHRCCVAQGTARVARALIAFLNSSATAWDNEEVLIPDEWLDERLAGANASMLCEAVRNGALETTRALLELTNSRPDHLMAGNCTPLIVAVYQGNLDIARLLLLVGANPNARMLNGITPIAVASFRGKLACARLLLSMGANPNLASADGTTPLMWAIQANDEEMVEFLLQGGADVNACKMNGSSPIIVAVRHGHANLIPKLGEYGGDPNLVLSNGATALVLASANGDMDAVEKLLQLNADTRLRLNSGAHALAYACHRGHRDIIVRSIAHSGRLPPADLDRLLTIARIKKHSSIFLWLELYRDHGSFQDLHFACSLGKVPRVYSLLKRHERFSALDRHVLPQIAAPNVRGYIFQALQPFSLRVADLWPSSFNFTVKQVIGGCMGPAASGAGGGALRDIFLLVFSFCDRDWFLQNTPAPPRQPSSSSLLSSPRL